MPVSYTFEIPNYRPPRLNQHVGRHWSVKHKLRKEAADMIAAYSRNVPRATGRRGVRVAVLRKRAQGNLPDQDAYGKLFLDALKIAGMIVDDGPKWLDRVDWDIYRSDRDATVVTLTEA